MIPKYIIIHHSAISRKKNENQFDAIVKYHKSLGWGNIGYHRVIEPNGRIRQGRAFNEIGAHCKEQGMNYQSLGICLTGNFDTESPTDRQIYSLRDELLFLTKKYKIIPARILFHRDLANYKSCPGLNLKRDSVRRLVAPQGLA